MGKQGSADKTIREIRRRTRRDLPGHCSRYTSPTRKSPTYKPAYIAILTRTLWPS